MAISRRNFLILSALGGGAAAFAPGLQAAPRKARHEPGAAPADAEIAWLDGAPPAGHEGQTWGVPWPRGTKGPRTVEPGDLRIRRRGSGFTARLTWRRLQARRECSRASAQCRKDEEVAPADCHDPLS